MHIPDDLSFADAVHTLLTHYIDAHAIDPDEVTHALGAYLAVALAEMVHAHHLLPDQIEELLAATDRDLRKATWACLQADAEVEDDE
jgi:hypothetical protein